MAHGSTGLHKINLPRKRLRKLAQFLFQLRYTRSAFAQELPPSKTPVKVVCVSDTHNLCPTLPSGDLLIHAGDLSEWGTFDEIQAQLSWLSIQPYQYKVVVAGNHDVLLDEEFLQKHAEHRDPKGRTRHDLHFGTVIYLQDASAKLSFHEGQRELNIFGSPWTPQYGTSAFQYPREEDIWSGRVPACTDILITHGPPSKFNGIKPSAGCPFLRDEVARVKPRLMVFGHIHFARGEELATFDLAQELHDDVQDGLRGWEVIPMLTLAVAWSRIRLLFRRPVRSTRMIDAAVVDGMNKDIALDAFAFDI